MSIEELNAIINQNRSVATRDLIIPSDHNYLLNAIKKIRDILTDLAGNGAAGIQSEKYTVTVGVHDSPKVLDLGVFDISNTLLAVKLTLDSQVLESGKSVYITAGVRSTYLYTNRTIFSIVPLRIHYNMGRIKRTVGLHGIHGSGVEVPADSSETEYATVTITPSAGNPQLQIFEGSELTLYYLAP